MCAKLRFTWFHHRSPYPRKSQVVCSQGAGTDGCIVCHLRCWKGASSTRLWKGVAESSSEASRKPGESLQAAENSYCLCATRLGGVSATPAPVSIAQFSPSRWCKRWSLSPQMPRMQKKRRACLERKIYNETIPLVCISQRASAWTSADGININLIKTKTDIHSSALSHWVMVLGNSFALPELLCPLPHTRNHTTGRLNPWRQTCETR